MDLLATNISTAFWCSIRGDAAKFEPAQVLRENGTVGPMSWLDELLKGGIWYHEGKPLILLISGPPGTGKSTLALELCFRLASRSPDNGAGGIGPRSSLFVSTDSDAGQIIEHADSFGWPRARDRIVAINDAKPVDMPAAVAVWGSEQITKWDSIADLSQEATDALLAWLRVGSFPKLRAAFRIRDRADDIADRVREVGPHVLVFDGLNALSRNQRGDVFQQMMRRLRKSENPPNLVVLILDTGVDGDHPPWEYVSDLVLKLDHTQDGYYQRTIEVSKARYQEHVWGRHQVKLYPRLKLKPGEEMLRRRAHPYRDEGGLYIYPSIHYYLSAYKRSAPMGPPTRAKTWPKSLETLLLGGYPEQRCTAFLGERGTHKSHLAYLHLLHRILHKGERGLIVSLRDDEAVTRRTLAGILEHEMTIGRSAAQCSRRIEDMEAHNQLEILYYVPGYITPEEFMHRMLMSVHRMRHRTAAETDSPRLTVIFNSLDQLASRFPLCANEQIFVPGLVEVLSGNHATTIFVAVEEAGQPPEQYGLLSMADLIVRFHLRRLTEADYVGHLGSMAPPRIAKQDVINRSELAELQGSARPKATTGPSREVVVLQVERFSGGQAAGARGILEFVDRLDAPGCVYARRGLHFVPLDRSYAEGDPV